MRNDCFVLLISTLLLVQTVPVGADTGPGQMGTDSRLYLPFAAPGSADSSLKLLFDGQPVPFDIIPAREPLELILLFDRLSLEKKSLGRTVKTVKEFLDHRENLSVMIILGGSEFEVLLPFTSDTLAISSALKRVEESETSGDKYRASKRNLIRTLSSAHAYTGSEFKPSAGISPPNAPGVGLEDAFGSMQVQQFRDQVNRTRETETSRILQTLIDIERTIRGTAGRDTRRHLLWIGEDLFAYPALDCYAALFDNFQAFRTSTNLKIPETWAAESNLEKQFKGIALLAEGMGISLDILDLSDWDRYSSARVNEDKRSTGIDKFAPGDPRNMVMNQTGAQAQSLSWGGRHLSSSTGGVYYGVSRDTGKFFERFSALLDATREAVFSPPDNVLDGRLHEVSISADEKDDKIVAPAGIAAAPALSRLIDQARAEMLIPKASHNLDFSIKAGEVTRLADGRVTQKFRILLSVPDFEFVPEDDARTAHLAIAVVMRMKDGSDKPARVFEIPVTVSSQQLQKAGKIASAFRLLVDDELGSIAFAVRDQTTGKSGTMKLDLTDPAS